MPAYSPSKLTVDLGTAGGAPDDPSVGAVGPVWAATDPSIATVANAGKWVPEKGKIEDDEFATGDGEKQAEALWKYCADTRDRLEGKSEL